MSSRFRSRRWNFPSRVRYARGRYSGRRMGTSSARRARGNMRAANQQNDISNVTINLMKKIKVGVTGYSIWENDKEVKYDIGACALNIFELLQKSEFYQSYSNMYDQFRVNRIQVKLTPVTWQTYNQYNVPAQDDDMGVTDGEPLYDTDHYGSNTYNNTVAAKKYIVPQALTVVTAWDRTGLDSTQIHDYTYNTTVNNEQVEVPSVVITVGDGITTYSSAKSTQLVAGANFNCVRYLYPSSQQEKSLYFSTSDLKEQIKQPVQGDKYYIMRKADNYDSKFITNLHADPNCPFKPTFLVGLLKVDDLVINNATSEQQVISPDNTLGQIYPVTFNLEFDIGVTFRGLRKTQVV